MAGIDISQWTGCREKQDKLVGLSGHQHHGSISTPVAGTPPGYQAEHSQNWQISFLSKETTGPKKTSCLFAW